MFSSIFFPNLKKNPTTLQIHRISVISFDTAPCIVRDLKGNFFVRLDKSWIITLLCKLKKSVQTFDSTFLQSYLAFFCGYHDIPWGFQALLLKLEKNSTAGIMSWFNSTQMTNFGSKLWWNLYSVIRFFFFLLISTGNHLAFLISTKVAKGPGGSMT